MRPATAKRPQRRPRTWKVLLLLVLLFLIVEPIVMFRALMHQRELRRDARQPVGLVATP